ncbi:hypothetical protein [Corynebacterium mastitidis]
MPHDRLAELLVHPIDPGMDPAGSSASHHRTVPSHLPTPARSLAAQSTAALRVPPRGRAGSSWSRIKRGTSAG